ncbi:MAG: metallopeptidase TldD-related protein [bacterium]
MIDNKTRELITRARDEARKAGLNVELQLHREQSSLIRLGNSSVALSTHEELTRLDVSAQDGRKVGSFSLTAEIVSADQLREAVGHAVENCRAALPKDYDPIFGAVEEAVDDSSGYDPALETLSPEAKTELCAAVIKAVKPRGRYDFSGSWSTGSAEMYYTTTANDRECYRRLTDGRFVLVLKEQDRKWELQVELTQKKAGAFAADEVIARFDALLPVYEKNQGHAAAPGRQRVLFGEQAIAQLVSLAIWGGFIGRSWEEKRSWTAGNKPGDKILADAITITDDPTNLHVFGMPFDFSGRRRRPFPIVERGVLRGLFYDSATAARYGRQPTGHDLGSSDIVLATGDGPAGLEAARQFAGDALYIPHLHYIHMPDPTKGLFTGSSRFNAMLIKGGKFTAPLFSTRVTDTSPSVFNNVVAMSSLAVAQNESGTYGRRTPEAMAVPEWLLCDNVRISDVADSF